MSSLTSMSSQAHDIMKKFEARAVESIADLVNNGSFYGVGRLEVSDRIAHRCRQVPYQVHDVMLDQSTVSPLMIIA